MIGGSLIFWAVMGWLNEPISPVRGSIIVFQICVGLLIMVRAPVALRTQGIRYAAVVLFSFVANGLVFIGAPLPAQWRLPAVAIFISGTVMALVSLFFLGRSFAVLPSLRQVKTHGPYALVRHPAYFGELVMLGGCCAAFTGNWPLALPGFAMCIAAIVLRIVYEERFLMQSQAYRRYADSVRWRLLPGVW